MTNENTKLGIMDQIVELAKARGISVKEYLEKMVKGSRIITRFREEHQSTVQPDTENGGTGLH